jgi:hypothetical protein
MQLFDQNLIPERTWSEAILPSQNAIINPRVVGGSISGSSIAIGSGNTIFKADQNGIYLGNTTFASAPFRVSMDGILTATGAVISGDVVSSNYTTSAPYLGYKLEYSTGDAWFNDVYIRGSIIDGTTTIGGRTASTLASAIDASGHFADSAISTATATIITPFTFGVSGALQIGEYVNGVSGDIRISPSGILGRDSSGATTFSINGTTGIAVLNGLVVGTNVGLGTAQDSAGVTTIIGDTVTTTFVNALNITANSVSASGITSGTLTSKTITLAVSAGIGDSYIAAGKTDFTNTDSGFILGVDDSDSDKSKFYIGNSTNYFNFNGTNVSFRTTLADAIIIDSGSNISLRDGGNITFSPLLNPTACTATLIVTGTGNVDNGTHSYKITYLNASGETALGIASNTVTVDASNKQVALSAIPISTSASVTSKKIYRTKAGGTDYYLLASITSDATTYTDNTADASLTGDIYNNKVNDSFGRIYVGSDKVLTVTSSNIFLGVDAGDVNGVGYDNIFIGRASGQSNTSADFNTFIGSESGISNTGGYGNTFIGKLAGYGNTDGYYNTRIGYKSGYLSDTEVNCVHLGAYAGYNNNLSNTLFIDNQDRGSAANDRSMALIYGTFAAAVADQKITFNANVGIGTSTWGANSSSVFAIANGTAPSAHVDDEIQIYSANSSDNTATLALMLEQQIEDIGTFTASHKIKIIINGTAYWLSLDAV